MFFIAGAGTRMKELGMAKGDCLACGSGEGLHVTRESQTISLFFIPVASFGARYYVTCTRCASVMELSRDGGKRLEGSPDTALCPQELVLIKNNSARHCSDCGRRVYDDQRFCPGCGQRL